MSEDCGEGNSEQVKENNQCVSLENSVGRLDKDTVVTNFVDDSGRNELDEIDEEAGVKENVDEFIDKDGGVKENGGGFTDDDGGVKENSGGFTDEDGGVKKNSGGFTDDDGGVKKNSGGFTDDDGGVKENSGGFTDDDGGVKENSGGFTDDDGGGKETDGGIIDENDGVKEHGGEFTEEVLHPQPEDNSNGDAQYSHPDIVLQKETTIFSYHDSDSDLADYNLDICSLHPGNNLDRSDADSWDWTFHDENVSDLDVKIAHPPRRRSSLQTDITDNFYLETQNNTSDLESHKQRTETGDNFNEIQDTNDQKCGELNGIKISPRKNRPEETCLLKARKSTNTAVAFLSLPNISERGAYNRHQTNQSESGYDVVYFEDLTSSHVLKTRLKYLGRNCSVGSRTDSDKEIIRASFEKGTKRIRNEEFIRHGRKPGKDIRDKHFQGKFTKLEEIFTCRPVHVNHSGKNNLFLDKRTLSSPVFKPECLPPIMDSRPVSVTEHSSVGYLIDTLFGWKLSRNRARSRPSLSAKSDSNEDSEKARDDPKITRKHQNMTGLGRFRYFGRTVLTLLRAVGIKPKIQADSGYKFRAWSLVYDEVLGISRMSYDSGALSFDPLMYKANRESILSQEIKEILRMPPSQRTDTHVHSVAVSLHNVIPSFSDFPKRIQQSMIKVATYERFEAGRVMIRQGHRAENFYFIISGSAVVTKMESGENEAHITSFLQKGNSFGELAFLHMSRRSATVTCRNDVELLCIERDDYIDIFMCPHKGQEPHHITFLKSVDLIQGWPVHLLPHDNPKICAFTYVRRDVILCQNGADSDWIFIVYSGTCKVLAALEDRPIRKREERPRLPETKKITLTPDFASLHNLSLSNNANGPAMLNAQHQATLLGLTSATGNLPDKWSDDSEDENDARQTEDQVHSSNNDVLSPNNCEDQIPREKTSDNGSKKVSFQQPLLPPTHSTSKHKPHGRGLQSPVGQHRGLSQAAAPSLATQQLDRRVAFVEVARLESGDLFGLERVVLSGMVDVASCSLVSEGAEVILISRSFFQRHLKEDTVKRIRQLIRPLPSEMWLQQKYQAKKLWDVYKSQTMAQQTHGIRRLNSVMQVSGMGGCY